MAVAYYVSGLLRWTARHRPLAMALLTTAASICAAVALQQPTLAAAFWILAVAALTSLVFVGLVPSRYEQARMIELLLPVIHKALGLKPEDRITVHVLRSIRSKTYEQLTEYYPQGATPGRGRIFALNNGIVGNCFHSVSPESWSIPAGEDAEVAYRRAHWQFADADVARVSKDKRSYFVYPIGREGHYAKAVLFADSSRQSAFDGHTARRLNDTIRSLFLGALNEALRDT